MYPGTVTGAELDGRSWDRPRHSDTSPGASTGRRPTPAHRDRCRAHWRDPAVGSGRLERIRPGPAARGSAATPQQRAMVAALDVPRAVAMRVRRGDVAQPGFALEPVHVLASRRPHHDGPDRASMHSSIRLRDEDVTTIDGIPVTTPVRTLRDLAGRVHPGTAQPGLRPDALAASAAASRRCTRCSMICPCVVGLPAGEMRKLILARPDGYRRRTATSSSGSSRSSRRRARRRSSARSRSVTPMASSGGSTSSTETSG